MDSTNSATSRKVRGSEHTTGELYARTLFNRELLCLLSLAEELRDRARQVAESHTEKSVVQEMVQAGASRASAREWAADVTWIGDDARGLAWAASAFISLVGSHTVPVYEDDEVPCAVAGMESKPLVQSHAS